MRRTFAVNPDVDKPPSPTAGDTPQERLAAFIRADALRLGFSRIGIAAADAATAAGTRLDAALAAGHHGSMSWLADTADRRRSPKALWPDAASVVVLGFGYGPDEDPLAATRQPDAGAISVYARNRDYHDLVKGRLKELSDRLTSRAARLGLAGDAKVFVDTAPVMEKPLAQAAGIGWQGKHTNLVSRHGGSWLLLGEIFTSYALPVDPPAADSCGSCTACLAACPTDAFPSPYRLDARRCISYLTIEHAGPIERALRPAIGNRIYGCDDCLAACPWNKFAEAGREAKLTARDDLRRPALARLAALDEAEFRAHFSGSPIKRIGRDRFIRNVLIAMGNSGRPDMIAAARPHLDDDAALVRGAAVWALSRLMTPAAFARLAAEHSADEPDAGVLDEWAAGRRGG